MTIERTICPNCRSVTIEEMRSPMGKGVWWEEMPATDEEKNNLEAGDILCNACAEKEEVD